MCLFFNIRLIYKKCSRTVFLIISFGFLFSFNTFAYNPLKIAGYKGYEGEGNFVEGASHAGDVVGISIVGPVAAVVTEPTRLFFPNAEFNDEVGYCIVKGGTKGFGCIFGAIPWCLKKVFHDIWVGYTPVIKHEVPEKIPHQLLYKIPVKKITNQAVPKEKMYAPTAEEEDIIQPEPQKQPPISSNEEELPELEKLPEPAPTPDTHEELTNREEKSQSDVLKIPEKPPISSEPIKVDPNLPSWIQDEIHSN